jgi:hypothetical protein
MILSIIGLMEPVNQLLLPRSYFYSTAPASSPSSLVHRLANIQERAALTTVARQKFPVIDLRFAQISATLHNRKKSPFLETLQGSERTTKQFLQETP